MGRDETCGTRELDLNKDALADLFEDIFGSECQSLGGSSGEGAFRVGTLEQENLIERYVPGCGIWMYLLVDRRLMYC